MDGFPRTPALPPSEGEGENHPQSRRESKADDNRIMLEESESDPKLSPLPRRGGEGQGEGASA